MDVVGHHRIGQHFAALAFKVMQRIRHDLSMRGFAKQALAVTLIEQSFQFAKASALELLPFSQFAAGHRGGAARKSLPP